MSLNLQLRLGAMVLMVATAIGSLTFFHFFGPAWSNRCDPGNEHFNVLRYDPVVQFRAQGELFTWVSGEPDNSWMCVNPRVTVSHYRPNQDKLFAELEDNLFANGWQWEFPDYQVRGHSGEELVKNASGLRLTAMLFREWMSSVNVVLEAPPLHLGESGFSSP
jgi:hypothetical protein